MAKLGIENAKRGTIFVMAPEELKLVTDPKHPLYDERVKLAVPPAFLKNIMHYGVKEPVLVAKEGDDVVVVAGRQRVKAAQMANLLLQERGEEPLMIRCLLERGDEVDLLGISISENEQRQEDSPLGRAKKMQRMLNLKGSEELVATAFGVTVQTLKATLKLLELPTEVQKAVGTGELSSSAAGQLHGLPKEEQLTALETLKTAPTNGDGRVKATSARAVRAATGKPVAKMRARREILARLEETNLPRDYRAALVWVLGTGDQEKAAETKPATKAPRAVGLRL